MKKIILLILGCLCSSLGKGQSTPQQIVNLQFQRITLDSILHDISEVTELQFSYGNLDRKDKLSFNFQGPAEDAIKALCKQENLAYKRIGSQIVLKKETPFGKSIRGKVIDVDSEFQMIGASVKVLGTSPIIGTSTDIDGHFTLPDLTVGRYDIVVEYLGYESTTISQVLVTTGKEVFLSIPIKESVTQLAEIVIVAKDDLTKPLNDMASSSARSFSVEETSRYAASINDPGRMALSFAGVTGGGDDGTNEIIIRGNTSRGLLWRLEGIEIPNPNHFSSMGSGGGAISMLSASTLTTSDFYTGAFPAEFGNASSGVFDLKMRNGNSQKREHSIQAGLIGLSASSEGPFKKGGNATYLVNYRYSTLTLLKKIVPLDGLDDLRFQDLTFKINVPINDKSSVSSFGIFGNNAQFSSFQGRTTSENQEFKQQMGLVGINYKYFLSENTNIINSIAYSIWGYTDETFLNDLNPRIIDESDFIDRKLILSSKLNHKLNSSNSFRAGINYRANSFKLDYESEDDESQLITYLNDTGSANLVDGYAQWKHRFNEKLSTIVGVNGSYFSLNSTYSIDPRFSLNYQINKSNGITFSTGIYSRPEHSSTYLIFRETENNEGINPNFDLPMIKSLQFVFGYDKSFSDKIRLKVELYYQSLYDVPVGEADGNNYSILNSSDVFDIIFQNNLNGSPLVSTGTGKNYGIDLTLEKFFSKGFYFLVTGSLFDSKYTTNQGKEFNTRYASNYVTNILGGKEWQVGNAKEKIVGFNFKFSNIGGIRQTPILLEESIAAGKSIFDNNNINGSRLPDYRRLDIGIFFKKNKKKSTHTFRIDFQNITDRRNIAYYFYNTRQEGIFSSRQNGILPFASYKVEF